MDDICVEGLTEHASELVRESVTRQVSSCIETAVTSCDTWIGKQADTKAKELSDEIAKVFSK